MISRKKCVSQYCSVARYCSFTCYHCTLILSINSSCFFLYFNVKKKTKENLINKHKNNITGIIRKEKKNKRKLCSIKMHKIVLFTQPNIVLL